MSKDIFKLKDIHRVKGFENIIATLDIKLGRFTRQFHKAQFMLDSEIMTDMVPYMPMVTSTFINTTKAMSAAIAGTGYVYAAAPPYGRFLYEGKTMVSPTTGSTWAELGEKKVLVSQYAGVTNAREDLTYNKQFHPKAQAKWFEASKAVHGRTWIKNAKRLAGGK